jgi:hypothetical protein
MAPAQCPMVFTRIGACRLRRSGIPLINDTRCERHFAGFGEQEHPAL